jgi:hypothetical protein
MFHFYPRSLGHVQILAILVVLAKASDPTPALELDVHRCDGMEGTEACHLQSLEPEEEDDFSLMQADHIKQPSKFDAHKAKHNAKIAESKDRSPSISLHKAAVPKRSSGENDRSPLSMLALSPSTAAVVGPEAAAAAKAAVSQPRREVDPMAVLPLRMAMSLSQTSTAFAKKLVAENQRAAPSVIVLLVMLGLIAALFVAVIVFNIDKPDDKTKEPLTAGRSGSSPRQYSGRAPMPQSQSATSAQMFMGNSGRRSPIAANAGYAGSAVPLAGSPRIPGTMSTPAPMGSAAQHLEQRVRPQDSPIISPNVESHFAIGLEALKTASDGSNVEILTRNGLPIFSLHILNGNRLDISLAHHGSPPRCSVIVPQEAKKDFLIHDASDKPLGTFRQTGPGDFEVKLQGRTTMIVQGSTNNLQFSVTDLHGSPLALGRVNKEDFKSEVLEIRVLPGSAEAQIVLAVVLALAIFTSSAPGA